MADCVVLKIRLSMKFYIYIYMNVSDKQMDNAKMPFEWVVGKHLDISCSVCIDPKRKN